MKTIEDHNAEREKFFDSVDAELRKIFLSYYQNEIECPRCASEMSDSSEIREQVGNVWEKEIHCPACGFKTKCLA